MTEPGQLTPDEAAAVIRRAAELDTSRPSPALGLDRAAIEEAAREVGISAEAVRRALAEHDARAELPPEPAPGVLGPVQAGAQRSLDLPVDLAEQRVAKWLRQQTFEPVRQHRHTLEWRRRDDWTANLRRTFDFARRVRLRSADTVASSVVDTGDGRALVRLDADLANTRRGLQIGWIALPGAAGPVAAVAVGVVTGEVAFPAVGVPASLALAGLGTVGGRRALARARSDTARELEFFLDRLEHGT